MATVVLTFTDVDGMNDAGSDMGTVQASLENDTEPVGGHYTPAQMLAAGAYRTAMRMSEVPPTLVEDDGVIKPMNDPLRDSPLKGL